MTSMPNERPANNVITISTAGSRDEIEGIRPAWEKLQSHRNSDIGHYLNVLGTRANIIAPHVMVVWTGGVPVSMAVGRIEQLTLRFKVGVATVYSPRVRALRIIYGGLLGEQTVETAEALHRELMRFLASGQVDAIRFDYLPVESPLYGLLENGSGLLQRDRFATVDTHWRMTLPESLDAFYQSRSGKHRGWLRRMERLLERDIPGGVRYSSCTSDSDLDRIFADAESIAQKTYQRQMGVGFVDNEETRRIQGFLARQGRLRVYFTHVKGEPSAFWLGELYRDTFTVFSIGYDPAYRKYELGTVLFLRVVDDLCKLGTVRFIDFGFGDASYKSRFGDHATREATLLVFAKSPRGVWLGVVRSLILGSHDAAITLARKLKLLDRLKSARRRRAAGGTDGKS
jgi:CelD/BcsL family acetyltransferase involved in cellulose biosynthesis